MQEIGQYFHAPTVLLSIIYKVILFQLKISIKYLLTTQNCSESEFNHFFALLHEQGGIFIIIEACDGMIHLR